MKIHPLVRVFVFALALLLILPLGTAVRAAEVTELHTAQDLLAIAENPSGDYILMADVDMAGIQWTGPDFSGTFDGNGHAILNLTLAGPGEKTFKTYDGNVKEYTSHFAGFFSSLNNATVKNLKLLNVRALVETEDSFFLGGLAGYAKSSDIFDCTVTGSLELRAFNKMFGIGGLVGYGSGRIEGCTLDVTLISTDTDEALDEMFLGGVSGMGFFDITNCIVNLDGYASEYGYVHSGGLMGMMIRYPIGDWHSSVSGNQVTGKISFFEKNRDRRAYCDAFIGEQMTKYCYMADNTQEFLRDERKEYIELRPDACETPQYTETLITAPCNDYGYTRYTCDTCGYSYMDHYTLFGDHLVSQWNTLEEATTEKEGLSAGLCDYCGEEFQRSEPQLDPPATEAPTEAAQQPTAPAELPPELEEDNTIWLVPAIILTVLAMALLLFIKPKKRGGRYQK